MAPTIVLMNIAIPTPLLGGRTPQSFANTHWQRKPLLVRQALPNVTSPATRSELFALAAQPDVESRLIEQGAAGWLLRHGPIGRRMLPPLKQPGWTLLVQGVDLHVDAARTLLDEFRFMPDARLDDLMISYASDGGGVGPHIDSYDVFLLQLAGRRRWRVGPVARPRLQPGVPLRILQNFRATDEWVLEPGDLLYVPPGWGHDGIALGPCMTGSIGFRAPRQAEVARELLLRTADAIETDPGAPTFRDAKGAATSTPGRLPDGMLRYAADAVRQALRDPDALPMALGEWLTEPKPQVWFDPGAAVPAGVAMQLDRRSRMLYDDERIYLNGSAYRAAGRDAALLRELADRRGLNAAQLRRLSAAARGVVDEWARNGWLRVQAESSAS